MSFDNDLLDAIRRCVPIFLRLALGVTFLTAVADRFGLCGQFGTPNVAWGDFARFTQYTGQLNPWAPAALVRGAGPWGGASPRALYQVVRTLERDPPVPVCLGDEHGNRD